MHKVEIEVFDVSVDGFPTKEDLGVCFFWYGDVYTGRPLIAALGNKYFSSPEQAKAAPLKVAWEAIEDRDHDMFRGVQFWFRKPSGLIAGKACFCWH